VKWFNRPQDALKEADLIVTDTWVSMGMDQSKEQRLRDFDGWQVNCILDN
jgi:ornithine carbamoyltransferase